MVNGISKMPNRLAKASGFVSVPQGDRVVCDRQDGPVCLGAVPGAHEYLSNSPAKRVINSFGKDSLEASGIKGSDVCKNFWKTQPSEGSNVFGLPNRVELILKIP